jgi:predicted enzyme related to lactoylglutathione lyase
MANKLVHFAVHVDDIDRARHFYESVFGWRTRGYGPPDFLQIFLGENENDGPMGALQSRAYNVAAEKVIGFECTIAVDDLDRVLETVVAEGGSLLMRRTAIPGVGWIGKFSDLEGNLVCALQYDQAAA